MNVGKTNVPKLESHTLNSSKNTIEKKLEMHQISIIKNFSYFKLSVNKISVKWENGKPSRTIFQVFFRVFQSKNKLRAFFGAC